MIIIKRLQSVLRSSTKVRNVGSEVGSERFVELFEGFDFVRGPAVVVFGCVHVGWVGLCGLLFFGLQWCLELTKGNKFGINFNKFRIFDVEVNV